MSTSQLDHRDPAEIYDCAMRFSVPSRSRPHITHMVDLDWYTMNGKCSCEFFCFKLEPILAQGITPEQAIEAGAVKLKKDQRPEDALRCQHLIDGYYEFGHIAARAISNAKKQTTRQEDSPPF